MALQDFALEDLVLRIRIHIQRGTKYDPKETGKGKGRRQRTEREQEQAKSDRKQFEEDLEKELDETGLEKDTGVDVQYELDEEASDIGDDGNINSDNNRKLPEGVSMVNEVDSKDVDNAIGITPAAGSKRSAAESKHSNRENADTVVHETAHQLGASHELDDFEGRNYKRGKKGLIRELKATAHKRAVKPCVLAAQRKKEQEEKESKKK